MRARPAALDPLQAAYLTLGVTLSPRLSDGHSEPSFSSDIDCVLQSSTAHNNTIVQIGDTRYYSVGLHCKNITVLGKGDGKLDINNAKQSFLYAWGPTDDSISSASKSASIKRHIAYGNFWMDMTAATSPDPEHSTIPTGTALLSTKNAGTDGEAESDGDKVGPAHAAIMLAAYVLIFPLGAILLRFLESVKSHYIVQTVGLFVTIIGVGVGIYLSMMYNHVSPGSLFCFLLTLARTVKAYFLRTSSFWACALSYVVCAMVHRFLPSSALSKIQTADKLWQGASIRWPASGFGRHHQWFYRV